MTPLQLLEWGVRIFRRSRYSERRGVDSRTYGCGVHQNVARFSPRSVGGNMNQTIVKVIVVGALLAAGPGLFSAVLLADALEPVVPVAFDQLPEVRPETRPEGPTLWLEDEITLPEVRIVGRRIAPKSPTPPPVLVCGAVRSSLVGGAVAECEWR